MFVISMWAQVSLVLSLCMCLTDGRTDRPSKYRALHYMQSHGKNWKMTHVLDTKATIQHLRNEMNEVALH